MYNRLQVTWISAFPCSILCNLVRPINLLNVDSFGGALGKFSAVGVRVAVLDPHGEILVGALGDEVEGLAVRRVRDAAGARDGPALVRLGEGRPRGHARVHRRAEAALVVTAGDLAAVDGAVDARRHGGGGGAGLGEVVGAGLGLELELEVLGEGGGAGEVSIGF
jgi:hypothetical protein